MSESLKRRPLGQKAYGSIGHLPTSRLGDGDHRVHEGQARICTERVRDRHDVVIVQEKVDGSCVAVARIGDEILALSRGGYLASSSPHEQHQLFAAWVRENTERFREVLENGWRLVGEWLALAHGTRYVLPHEPFVAFDLMWERYRTPYRQLLERISDRFVTPRLLHEGASRSVESIRKILEPSGHGAVDPVEGAVWRVERRGSVDFLAKWVRPDKEDGRYLPEKTGHEPIWHWRPKR